VRAALDDGVAELVLRFAQHRHQADSLDETAGALEAAHNEAD
jgi:hypothetical protein